ncbi:MAG: hypothetical protein LBJ64_02825 [Deltaproteobacteria bacterium]|jgi:hypothetical protein|nr:hypothetical protein [Deltaproteobacteria bacterium]
MKKQVMDVGALPEFIVNAFGTTSVLVHEINSIVTIEPISMDKPDYAADLRGLLSEYPEMSVDKFLERKRSDKELDL